MHPNSGIKFLFLSLGLFSTLHNQECHGMSIEKELTLTRQQKSALDQLKEEISPHLEHEYMKKDIYLVKWLRAKNYNVQQAKEMLYNHLLWRRDNQIDGILKEDFSFYKREFPFWVDGVDFTGRPVLTADISAWEPRKVILAGKAEEAYRFVISVVELGTKMIRDAQAKGLNVSQGILVGNLQGFNLIQHACIQCIPYFVRGVIEAELNYPGLVHKTFLINTPPTFDILYRTLLPFGSPESLETLEIFGRNKNRWQEAILKEIPSDQIRPQFGGTKVSNILDDEWGLGLDEGY